MPESYRNWIDSVSLLSCEKTQEVTVLVGIFTEVQRRLKTCLKKVCEAEKRTTLSRDPLQT